MKFLMSLAAVIAAACLTGCATVDVTKTAVGYHAPTDPNHVQILMSAPKRDYTELATISTTNWEPGETAKMHNALRAKSAPLGAHAVVLLNSGIQDNKLWSTGMAIRYVDE